LTLIYHPFCYSFITSSFSSLSFCSSSSSTTTGGKSIFYLSEIISFGFLYGTAPSTSQIILKVASKFVKANSSASNSIDGILSKLINGISSNMVNLTIIILTLIFYYFHHLNYDLYILHYIYLF